jgi:hypothetical protein
MHPLSTRRRPRNAALQQPDTEPPLNEYIQALGQACQLHAQKSDHSNCQADVHKFATLLKEVEAETLCKQDSVDHMCDFYQSTLRGSYCPSAKQLLGTIPEGKAGLMDLCSFAAHYLKHLTVSYSIFSSSSSRFATTKCSPPRTYREANHNQG